MKNHELASYFCDEFLARGLTHPPLVDYLSLSNLLASHRFSVRFLKTWRDSQTDDFYSMAVMEDGLCMTFNQISANLIFRNDTVDPKFLKELRQDSSKMKPQSWSIETGYTSDGMQFYPLKSLNSGPQSGFGVALAIRHLEDLVENLNTHCRDNPEFIKIALHHPAEVALKTSFILMPFHKIVSIMVKPKITTTSDSLKSYDPEV